MRAAVVMALAAATLVAACGGRSPSESAGPDGGLTAVTSASSYRGGEQVPVVFRNRTGDDVTSGVLPCTAWLERRNGSDWTPLVPLRVCVDLAVIVAAGTDLAFTAEPPDGSGTYRIVFDVLAGGRKVTVRSGAFTVQ